MAFLRRRREESPSNGQARSREDEAFEEACPALSSYVTKDEFDDHTKRLTSSLTIFCDEGVLKAVLNDREAGESLWVSAPGFMTLIHALEKKLALGDGEWRKNRTRGDGKGRRR